MLDRVAVLGWSMGGMMAQALAVLHPRQVSKIVPAARQPGTGHADPIPPEAAEAARSKPGSVISKLILYPGAGHASLFQDMSSFLPALKRFLR